MRSTTRDIAVPTPNLAAWGNLAVAIALLNGGNLLLDSIAKGAGITLDLFLSPGFVLAIASLGLAFLFYVRSLARLPLAVAYPVMVGLSMIIVAVVNHFWLGTPLAQLQLLGILTLFLGIVLISPALPDRTRIIRECNWRGRGGNRRRTSLSEKRAPAEATTNRCAAEAEHSDHSLSRSPAALSLARDDIRL